MKLELERLLEEGFTQLGVSFSPRVSGREMWEKVAADPVSRAKLAKLRMPEMPESILESPEEFARAMLANAAQRASRFFYNREEWYVAEGLPLFVRESELHKGLKLTYEVEPLDDQDIGCTAEEEITDRVQSQEITISDEKGYPQVLVGAERASSLLPYVVGVKIVPKIPSNLAIPPERDLTLAIEKVNALDNTEFNPAEVYHAVMAFWK
ncbi:MAG: hypothetical protein AABX70_05010 [Nanoarchaeota archaeon]